jgi:hypothetical protein
MLVLLAGTRRGRDARGGSQRWKSRPCGGAEARRYESILNSFLAKAREEKAQKRGSRGAETRRHGSILNSFLAKARGGEGAEERLAALQVPPMRGRRDAAVWGTLRTFKFPCAFAHCTRNGPSASPHLCATARNSALSGTVSPSGLRCALTIHY